MQQVDSSTMIIAAKGKEQWNILENIPGGEEFTKSFIAKSESTKRGHNKIMVHCTMSTKQWLNNIKWNPQFMTYLKAKNIFINFK
eukprot:800901-Ditylum_brightwellii.AAC.1